MQSELYCDGVSEVTVTGSIVRIDLMSLSATEKDEHGKPRPVFRQRIIMPADAFANAVDLLARAQSSLVDVGAIRRTEATPAPANSQTPPANAQTSQVRPGAATNNSPNFS